MVRGGPAGEAPLAPHPGRPRARARDPRRPPPRFGVFRTAISTRGTRGPFPRPSSSRSPLTTPASAECGARARHPHRHAGIRRAAVDPIDGSGPVSMGIPRRGGVPNGIRTRVSALKGLDPRPLDDGDAAGRSVPPPDGSSETGLTRRHETSQYTPPDLPAQSPRARGARSHAGARRTDGATSSRTRARRAKRPTGRPTPIRGASHPPPVALDRRGGFDAPAGGYIATGPPRTQNPQVLPTWTRSGATATSTAESASTSDHTVASRTPPTTSATPGTRSCHAGSRTQSVSILM